MGKSQKDLELMEAVSKYPQLYDKEKTMRRSAEFDEQHTELENETREEPKPKKDRSHERTTNIPTLDNGTLVEALKYLNYCGLAKNSLVSKRFCNIICTNRHRLALLYVDKISMVHRWGSSCDYIVAFNKQHSGEEYNEWVIRNNYSQQIAMKGQYEHNFYELTADAYYKDCNHRHWNDTTSVFFTRKELNHENWPVFQHFVRLITDPFIYIRSMELTPQNDGLNLLAGAFNSDRDRLKCETLIFNLEINSQNVMSWIKGHLVCHKFKIHNYSRSNLDEELVDFFKTGASCTSNSQKVISWIKGHVVCDKLKIYGERSEIRGSNFDEELLNFFMTGASCTSKISAKEYDLSYVIRDFVQKFMELKKFDESQIVQSIKSNHAHMVLEILTRNYAQFILQRCNLPIARTSLQNEEHVIVYQASIVMKKEIAIVGEKTMRRLSKWVEKQTGIKSETQEGPKAKKDRSHKRTTNTATLDNETLVEAFKSLNYCQLAKNSLVSKKFWNLIQTNRHRLALLYVDSIRMIQYNTNRSNYGWIKMFDKKFSPKEYSEWVIRNNYSQQTAIEGQAARLQRSQYERNFYELTADAYYKDCKHRHWDDKTSVFSTCKQFNHENWPVFQHFVRLVIDPFIYIRSLILTPQNDGLNILAGAFNSDRDRLKCETLIFNLEVNSQNVMSWIKGHLVCHQFKIHNYSRSNLDEELVDFFKTGASCTSNSQKVISWIKGHVVCDKLKIYGERSEIRGSNFDKELVDFFMTGASCTSKISFKYYDLSYVIFDFVQKFMDLKKFDENQIVQSIKSKRSPMVIDVLTRNYAKFIVKEEVDEEKETALTIFHFINNDVGKKMELTLETTEYDDYVFLLQQNI